MYLNTLWDPDLSSKHDKVQRIMFLPPSPLPHSLLQKSTSSAQTHFCSVCLCFVRLHITQSSILQAHGYKPGTDLHSACVSRCKVHYNCKHFCSAVQALLQRLCLLMAYRFEQSHAEVHLTAQSAVTIIIDTVNSPVDFRCLIGSN